jgi:hypothetical protein
LARIRAALSPDADAVFLACRLLVPWAQSFIDGAAM